MPFSIILRTCSIVCIYRGPAMEPTTTKKNNLTKYIIICLIIGIAVGFGLNQTYLSEENKALDKIEVSINRIQDQINAGGDSLALAGLEKEKASFTKQRSTVLAARDTKVEPFALIADIFLRLIKMIVAPWFLQHW
jgi:hypothetical protein